jgi:hypothetical protein
MEKEKERITGASPQGCRRTDNIFNSTFDADQKSSHDDYRTCSYRYSHSVTLEHSSSRVSRSEGEGDEWVRGLSRLQPVCNYPLSCTYGNPIRKWHMSNKACDASRFVVNNIFTVCHVQVPVNRITCRGHVLS